MVEGNRRRRCALAFWPARFTASAPKLPFHRCDVQATDECRSPRWINGSVRRRTQSEHAVEPRPPPRPAHAVSHARATPTHHRTPRTITAPLRFETIHSMRALQHAHKVSRVRQLMPPPHASALFAVVHTAAAATHHTSTTRTTTTTTITTTTTRRLPPGAPRAWTAYHFARRPARRPARARPVAVSAPATKCRVDQMTTATPRQASFSQALPHVRIVGQSSKPSTASFRRGQLDEPDRAHTPRRGCLRGAVSETKHAPLAIETAHATTPASRGAPAWDGAATRTPSLTPRASSSFGRRRPRGGSGRGRGGLARAAKGSAASAAPAPSGNGPAGPPASPEGAG